MGANRVPKSDENRRKRGFGNGIEKSVNFRGGSSVISVFPLQREHRNHFPAGFPKELKKESKIDEKSRKVGFRKVSENTSGKMMEKMSKN